VVLYRQSRKRTHCEQHRLATILIKALVDADDDVELMHAHDVVEKDMYGNDVTRKQGCFWNIS